MRINQKFKHKQTGMVYELQLLQPKTRDRHGNMSGWVILKNPMKKYPQSVSSEEFGKDYAPV